MLMTAPSKNNHHLGGKTCPVVMGAGGQFIDPVAEITNMLAVDPLPAGKGPRGDGWHPASQPVRSRRPLSAATRLLRARPC